MYDAYNYRYHAYVKVEDTQSVVNTDELKALVETAKAAIKADYGDTEWAALQQAITAAEGVLGNEAATQVEVYNAYKTLQAALADTKDPQPVKPDKSDLQEAVDNAKKDSEKDKYTADTWKAYQDALAYAKAVLGNENATEAEIAKALADLQKAEDGLKPVSGGTEKPSTGDKDNGGASKGPDKAAQTGDTTPLGMLFALTVASAAVAGAAVYRKKRG